MATLRLSRIAAGIEASAATLRLSRIAVGVVTTPAPVPITFQLRRIVAGIEQLPVTFAVNASANVTGQARPYQRVQFTGTATPPAGQTITSWLWTALSSDAPTLSSRLVQNPWARMNPQLTDRVLEWSLTVTTNEGLQSTDTVSVAVEGTPLRTKGLDGTLYPFAFLGPRPGNWTDPPPPPVVSKLRLHRITAGVQAAAAPPPPPPGENTTTLIGGRVNLPGEGGNESTWFTTGETWYGELQCTKDYFPGGGLPTRYNSPFPARVTILLSHANDTNFPWNWDRTWKGSTQTERDANQARWATYINSIPAGTILTFQHEPERPNNFMLPITGERRPWTGEEYVDLLNTYRAMVRQVRTDIPVWMFSSGYQYRSGNPGFNGRFFSGSRAADSTQTYRNQSDGYGYDGYRAGTDNGFNAVVAVQDRAEVLRWKSFIPAGKPWGMSEVGFGRVDNPPHYPEPGLVEGLPAQRIAAVEDSVEWLIDQGAEMFLYFFSGDGPDGHNWLPVDEAFKTMYQNLPRKT